MGVFLFSHFLLSVVVVVVALFLFLLTHLGDRACRDAEGASIQRERERAKQVDHLIG